MDGDRDRPAGGKNWSRRDGIRAGAVSGPWRSLPRAADARAPSEDAEVVSPVRPAATIRRARRTSTSAWIAVGCLAAVGLTLLGWLLRPDAAEQTAEPVVATIPATADAAVPAPVADPAPNAVGSVRVRIPEALPAARRDAIVAALREGGVADVRVEALSFAVARSRVGYYREADRGAAEGLARAMAPLVTPGGVLAVRDYGKLLDDPEPGRLDLWVRD